MKGSLVLALVGLSAFVRADIVNGFDANAEGWRAANIDTGTFAITYQDPTWVDGHIEASEFASGLFLLAAPSEYLGDLSSYYGGSVSFRLSDVTNSATAYPALILQSGFTILYYEMDPPGTSLTNFEIPLSPTGWRTGLFGASDPEPTQAQFQTALAGITNFGINADWTLNGVDVVALDDVHVAAVPEPVSLAALGFGCVALVRRRKS